MDFLEKDLEEIIYTADRAELCEKGLDIRGKLYKQLRIGNYGVADLIEVTRIPAGTYQCGIFIPSGSLRITVFELKKEMIGISAFLQAVGYAKGIHNYLKKRNINHSIKIALIGKRIDESSTFSYLANLLHSYTNQDYFLTNYTYKYSVCGLSIHKEGDYELANEGF